MPSSQLTLERETVDIPTVAKILGIHRSTCYELAARNELPVRVIQLGRRLVVSRRALDRVLAGEPPVNPRARGNSDDAA